MKLQKSNRCGKSLQSNRFFVNERKSFLNTADIHRWKIGEKEGVRFKAP